MSGAITKYVMPGLQTLGGAASEFFAPGNPAGIAGITGGVSQIAGNALGGGGGPASSPGAMNPFAVGGASSGSPSIANTGAAMPATPPQQQQAAAPPSAPPTMTPPGGAPSEFDKSMSALGPVGNAYLNYVQNMKLLKQKQKTDYAPPHSSSPGQTSPLSLQPQMPIQIPGSI